MTDGQLLECFLARRDEAAFAALVRRHGPMVLGVCRRVLCDAHDAEDAFQVTFLVLVRKAASLRQRELVGNWLYGTAYRAALETRAGNAARQARERQVRQMPEPQAADETDVWHDLRPLLDQELNHLPDKYRVPIVLCDLEGRKRKDIARQLRIPEGTLSSRLATARTMLARRLARHRLAVSGATLALALSELPATGVPSALVVSTIHAATNTGAIAARVSAMTEGVLKTMLLNRLKTLTAGLLSAAVILVSVALTYHAAGEPPPAKEAEAPRPSKAEDKVGEVRCFEGHAGGITRVAFSPDGRLGASSSMSNTVRVWELATGKLVLVLEGHSDRVDCVTFSPDGKRLLSCSWDGTTRLWDAQTGKQLSSWDSQGNPGLHVSNVIFFKDGKQFLWNAADHEALQIWDADKGQKVKEFGEHPDHVVAVALSPDGKFALEGNWDSKLRLWDIESGKELRQLEGHTGAVYCVAISPDGKQALSVSNMDKFVILWDLESGKELRRFEGHTESPLDFVAFSPDGRRALSVSCDKTMRLWDVATGKELHCFQGHTERVGCVAVSPDGRYALSGSEDRTVRLWRLPK
jgi:RNA polymerase sigma factor (sigma-70 family)